MENHVYLSTEVIHQALVNAYKVGSAEADLVREWELHDRAVRAAEDILAIMLNYLAASLAEQ